MEQLTGKNALITGAGKGLGKAIAMALAAEGVNLALVSRTKSDLDKVAQEIHAQHADVKIVVTTADAADHDSVLKACNTIKEELGQVDILVNNAGIGKFGKFMDLSVAEFEAIIQTNLLGPYYFIRQVLPAMQDAQSGDIINISSTAGLKGAPATSAYSASKFGLIGLSESLMLEARKSNIRVFTVTPSTIATDMAVSLNLTDGNPEKVLQAEDLAELVVAHLKLPRRALVRDVSLLSTNP